ncbi:MAG TPA: phosphoadenylyl-sulfate reductase [Gemmatimonadaceae bacterium]|nr:phosphoadenylyl-sulfate reductase [Gemmatimonadaceae bacterium]
MLSAADIRARADELRHRHPEEILAWSVREFPGRIAVTLSFGGVGVILAHMLSRIGRRLPVIFLDTGFLFEETHAFKDTLVRRYGLEVVTMRPLSDPGPLYQTDPDRCCAIRKVEPMERAIRDYDAWVSAIRRDQGASRGSTDVVEHHDVDGRALIKVHPLALWSRADVWRYIHENDVPYHPLLDQGYSSLGCWPCTRRTQQGEDERAGRWSGTGKTECGLHTFTARS